MRTKWDQVGTKWDQVGTKWDQVGTKMRPSDQKNQTQEGYPIGSGARSEGYPIGSGARADGVPLLGSFLKKVDFHCWD